VHREDGGTRAHRREGGDQLLRGAAKAVRIVLADVRVGVEELDGRQLVEPGREGIAQAATIEGKGYPGQPSSFEK